MSAADIAVVVVTYRSAETIALCLEALKAADGVDEIRVVDNGSDDGTMDVVQHFAARDPRIRFIANPDNPGFAVACNQGARECTAAWLAFVNPDLMVERDSLTRLRDTTGFLQGGMAGADLVDEAGQHDPAARRRAPDFAAMLKSAAARDLSITRTDTPIQIVDAISGALMVLPRTLFNEVGGFDEGYRLHAEDLDLCRRVLATGASIAIDNRVVVTHVRGVSSKSRPFFVEWHKHRGFWRYFNKFDAHHHSIGTRLSVFAMIWARFLATATTKAARQITGVEN